MSDDGEDGAEVTALRLDKWLWHARFFKTRTLSAKLCASGGVHVNGVAVSKAHQLVRPGDVVMFAQGRHMRRLRVMALGTRRGPAAEAQQLYEDLAPPTPETALPIRAPSPAERYRSLGPVPRRSVAVGESAGTDLDGED